MTEGSDHSCGLLDMFDHHEEGRCHQAGTLGPARSRCRSEWLIWSLAAFDTSLHYSFELVHSGLQIRDTSCLTGEHSCRIQSLDGRLDFGFILRAQFLATPHGGVAKTMGQEWLRFVLSENRTADCTAFFYLPNGARGYLRRRQLAQRTSQPRRATVRGPGGQPLVARAAARMMRWWWPQSKSSRRGSAVPQSAHCLVAR